MLLEDADKLKNDINSFLDRINKLRLFLVRQYGWKVIFDK
jgi:hypothetical protein